MGSWSVAQWLEQRFDRLYGYWYQGYWSVAQWLEQQFDRLYGY